VLQLGAQIFSKSTILGFVSLPWSVFMYCRYMPFIDIANQMTGVTAFQSVILLSTKLINNIALHRGLRCMLQRCFSNCGTWTASGLRCFARWLAEVRRRFWNEDHCQNCNIYKRMKNAPIQVCAKTGFFGYLQQKVCKLIISITSYLLIIIS
jgi:hypothetical protein